jgi:hypothetical protein
MDLKVAISLTVALVTSHVTGDVAVLVATPTVGLLVSWESRREVSWHLP